MIVRVIYNNIIMIYRLPDELLSNNDSNLVR